MNKRTSLKLAFGVIATAGLTLSLIPLESSLSINAKQENDAWISCDVSDLPKGSTKSCGRSVVYHRTNKDRELVDKYAALLADPDSTESQQPGSARNHWRSSSEDFFVFRPWAPVRGCDVALITSENYYGWKPPENEALAELPYFIEPCEGRTWDMSGRLYHRKGYPPERNLIVPKVNWVSPTKVLIFGG